MQLASVAGVWGIAFLMNWFASTVNWAWKHDFQWVKIKSGLGIYLCILLLTLILGGARASIFPIKSKTVRVASVTVFNEALEAVGKSGELDKEVFREAMVAEQSNLLDLSRKAAGAKARIVFWEENAVPVLKADEAVYIEHGQELASQEKIYLVMVMSTIPDGFPEKPFENKLVLIDPSGKVKYEYLKSKPVPGENCVKGEGKIPILNTPHGKIAAAICFDMDFPGLIRQAGKNGADIVLVPSSDWKEIDPLHTHMAVFRAIENGFSMVRSVDHGLSMAVDYQGRVLAVSDYFTAAERVMFSDVPTKGTCTIYSKTGDLFAWLCILGFLTTVLRVLIKKKK
ncbi:MAG: hypothetical protein JRJ39_08825 [Deltaproteobacteria bacterium]|nr:hypothetical protein [Deltaproteobacteria bacterium]